jgi:hypothetical protein
LFRFVCDVYPYDQAEGEDCGCEEGGDKGGKEGVIGGRAVEITIYACILYNRPVYGASWVLTR